MKCRQSHRFWTQVDPFGQKIISPSSVFLNWCPMWSLNWLSYFHHAYWPLKREGHITNYNYVSLTVPNTQHFIMQGEDWGKMRVMWTFQSYRFSTGRSVIFISDHYLFVDRFCSMGQLTSWGYFILYNLCYVQIYALRGWLPTNLWVLVRLCTLYHTMCACVRACVRACVCVCVHYCACKRARPVPNDVHSVCKIGRCV